VTAKSRSLTLTAEMLQAYSRRGNYHSDPDEARRVGLPGLLAQGMQAAGPAYGLLLDEWGEHFLEHGELDLRFVGMVWEGQTVVVDLQLDGDTSTISVTNTADGRPAVVGSARRSEEATESARG
jgi:acyl dehydratase